MYTINFISVIIIYLFENLTETGIWYILENQMLQGSVSAPTYYVADDSWWDTFQAFAFINKRMHNHLSNKDKEAAGYQVVVTGWYKVTGLSFK